MNIKLLTLLIFAPFLTDAKEQLTDSNIFISDSSGMAPELRVYKNPSNNFTRIEFLVKQKGKANVEVISATGKLLDSIPKSYSSEGLKILELDTTMFKSGVYFIRVNGKIMQFLIV